MQASAAESQPLWKSDPDGAPAVPAIVGTTGYAVSNAEMAAVMPEPDDAQDESVLDVKLPPDIAAILEESAKKLSRGLAGRG